MPTSAVTIPVGITTPGMMLRAATEDSDMTSAPTNMLPGR